MSSFLPQRGPLRWATFGVAVVLVAALVISCRDEGRTTVGRSSAPGLRARTDQGEVLLGTAIDQLSDLPSYVQTDLNPPQVVLDSRSSLDGQDIQATVRRSPQLAEDMPFYNYLTVETGNARFRGLHVEPGDIVKYYIDVDTEALATESKFFSRRPGATDPGAPEGEPQEVEWTEGFVREKAIEFTVAQVIDENTLIITPPLPIPWTEPANIEIWRYSDERMLEIARRLGRYANRRQPPLAWEPTPDEHVLLQILDRLNPWLRQKPADPNWRLDPLLETLPAAIRKSQPLQEYITADALTRSSFTFFDVRKLHEAVWLRDIAQWARGESFDPLERATALFDWTVRHIQLDAQEAIAPQWPWQTLLYGHGTAEDRAWVFALLGRQLKLDTVILSLAGDGEQPPEFWLVALVHNDELYLFDPLLGLPIPGPGGEGVATLAQLRDDPAILESLGVDGTAYRVDSQAAQNVVAGVVATPFELSSRAVLLEGQLTGDDRAEIAVDASAIADRARSAGLSEVGLWSRPLETLEAQLALPEARRRDAASEFQPFAWRPLLYKARVLHFQGKYEVRTDPTRTGWEEIIDSHQEAGKLYTHPRVRPPQRILETVESTDKREVYAIVKENASYWVGLLSYDDGRFEAAADWFKRRTLEDHPDGTWTHGARYNLARAYEQLGRIDEAIQLYEADDSPQRHGNLLRVRRLREQHVEKDSEGT